MDSLSHNAAFSPLKDLSLVWEEYIFHIGTQPTVYSTSYAWLPVEAVSYKGSEKF